jgi:hypothetical protein
MNLTRPFLWCFPVIYFLEPQNFTFLDSPVPLIVGSDITTQQFKFHYGMMDQRDHSFVYYYVEENVLEGKIDDLIVPSFNGKIDKVQKRFKRLKQFFTATNFQLKNKEAYLNNFLIKIREMLDGSIVDPIMRYQLFIQDPAVVVEKLIERNKTDQAFLTQFGKTQTFTKFMENLKRSLSASGGSLPNYEDMI